MSTPRHRTAPGASYFVTTKCWQGRQLFQVREIAEILLQTLFYYKGQRAYLLHEFVLMPDHLHLLLTPNETTSLEKAVQLIKGGSSHRIHHERNHKMEIWQKGFYDWTIRDFDDWQTKVEYIRLNPVRAKLVVKPEEWPFSSASGRFTLDSIPVSSGAKAPFEAALAPGLKPRPPKEGGVHGPKGPIPVAHANTSAENPRKLLAPMPRAKAVS